MNIEELFVYLLNMSITAGYVILAVILLRLLLKKAPKWIYCTLWALVGLRLLFPFSFESVLSLIPSAKTVVPGILYAKSPTINSGIAAVNNAVNPAITESMSPMAVAGVNPMQILMSVASIIWIAGMLAMLLYSVITYWRVRRIVAFAVPLKENIYQCDAVTSPFVLGIIRPRIYLPFDTNESGMYYVIAHEKAHIARKDHLIKPLGFLLLTVYWFNPLVWVAYILLCRDIELACDEHVLKEIDSEERKAYSTALLDCAVNRRNIAMCPLTFGEVGVKQRVKYILNYKKPAFWIIIVAIVSCVIVTACFLTNPESGDTVQTDYFSLVLPDGYKWSQDGNGKSGVILKRSTVIGGVNVYEYAEHVEIASYDSTHEFLSYIGLDPYHGKTPTYMASSSKHATFNCSISLPDGSEEKMHYFFYDGGDTWYDLWLDGSTVPQEKWSSFEAGMTLIQTSNVFDYDHFDMPSDVPDAVKEFATEYVQNDIAYYNSLDGQTIADAKITGLTMINTGTASLTRSVQMWLLEYRLLPDNLDNIVLAGGMRMEDIDGESWITEWGSTGQPYLLLVCDDAGTEASWQRICVTNTDVITQDYGTPEMLERYGNEFTAAAMELYNRFLEDQETAAHATALESAIIDFMSDGWWYAGNQKASDFKAASFITLYEEAEYSSLIYYGISMYRSYGYSGGGFSAVEDFLIPCVITLDETTLSCTDFWVPGDGAYFDMDIYEKFPADIADNAAQNCYQYYDQLAENCDKKAMIYGGIDLSDYCVTITSNSETIIPYENQLWAHTYGNNGWIYADGRSVYDSLSEISSSLPSVTLREDFDISYANGVTLSDGLDVYAADYECICHNADMLYLTALPEGIYYVSINVTKLGNYVEAEDDYESFGYECAFCYVVDENSYKRLFMSRPVDDKFCLMLRLTYKYGAPGYILPDEQDVWINAVESAVNTVKEDRHFMESETSLGLFIIWQDEYWQFMDSGALVSSAGRVEPEDAAELYTLIKPIAEKYDIYVFRPDMVENLVTATLEYSGTFTITDADTLSKLQHMLSGATEIRGGTACPFDAILGLELEDGTFLRLAMATDSCAVYMVNGVYFDYSTSDNTEFFSLFGISP